jgi:hypothetical protein
MSLIISIGQQFRKARAKHGCSAGTIGQLINITQSDWLAFELGMGTREKINVQQLTKAASFLGFRVPQSEVKKALGGK